MKLTLHAHDDLPELERVITQSEQDGLTDATYQTIYKDMTRTRRVLTLGESLFIAHTVIQTPVELELIVDNPNEGMEMHLNLSGAAHSQFDGKRVAFNGAQHNQLYFSGFRESIHYMPNTLYSCLEVDFWPLHNLHQRLVYRPEQLENSMARVAAGQTFALGQARPVLPRQQQIIHELLHSTLASSYRRIYLEAKVWELYALQSEQFLQEPASPLKLSTPDIDRLHYVRELMAQSMDNPASRVELTRLTGLNLDKLKRGFKAVFGTTVFGYLHELRMNKAYELLTVGNQSIAEIAYAVGYKNPQHFTAAFKKQYSCLPSTLRK